MKLLRGRREEPGNEATYKYYKGMKNDVVGFSETTAFERYGMKTSKKANYALAHLNQLARSTHHGRIKLLRGYVSKSSTALNPLTITQLACER